MEILEQYKKEHPEAFREAPSWQPPQEYGFWIRLVMRLSGGRIQNIRQASLALLIIVGVVVLIILFLMFGVFSAGIDTSQNFIPAETPDIR